MTPKWIMAALMLGVAGIATAAEPVSTAREFAYGADAKQRLDLSLPAAKGKKPVLLFIHGGGWSIGDKRHSAQLKQQFITGLGWAYVSTNYRLVPDATVEQQAADVAAAIAWIRNHAAEQGLDPDRIVLMGHSAGAHLAALVAADTRYLGAAGVPVDAIDGVILLDGAGYDVAKQMGAGPRRIRGMYHDAFGTDPARQQALSPITHAGKPNAPNWLVLHVARRDDSRAQSEALVLALRDAGTKAEVLPIAGESHMTINRELGKPGEEMTRLVADFLAQID